MENSDGSAVASPDLRKVSSFSSLLVKHDRAILRYITTFVPGEAEAEEILQRVAIFLWEHFAEYEPLDEKDQGFLMWATRVAYFEVLNYRKEAARRRFVFDEETLALLAEAYEKESAVVEAQLLALRGCLGKLDPESTRLLRKRYCDAVAAGAIAADLKTTVKSLYRRLDRLREKIMLCVEHQLRVRGIT